MSCDLSKYLNQEVTWGKTIGIDDYGKYEHQDTVIKCRMEERSRLAKNSFGSEVMSSNTLFVIDEIGINDIINDKPVLSVTKMTALDGSVLGYEVLI